MPKRVLLSLPPSRACLNPKERVLPHQLLVMLRNRTKIRKTDPKPASQRPVIALTSVSREQLVALTKEARRRKVKRKADQARWVSGPKRARASKVQFLRRIAKQGGVRDTWHDWYAHIVCQECQRGDEEDQILLCDTCDCGFHMHCLRPILVSYPKGSWYCDACATNQRPVNGPSFEAEAKDFRTNQKSIVDYFQLIPATPGNRFKSQANEKKARHMNARAAKHRQCFRVAVPVRDAMRRLMQLATFASAMKINGMECVHMN